MISYFTTYTYQNFYEKKQNEQISRKTIVLGLQMGEIKRIIDSRIKVCPYIDLYKNSSCTKYAPIYKIISRNAIKK